MTAQLHIDTEINRIKKYKDTSYNLNISLQQQLSCKLLNECIDINNLGIDLPLLRTPKVSGTILKWKPPKLTRDILDIFSTPKKQGDDINIIYQILCHQNENENEVEVEDEDQKLNDAQDQIPGTEEERSAEWDIVDVVKKTEYDMYKYVPCKVKIRYIINNIFKSESRVISIQVDGLRNDDEIDPILTRINSRGYTARLGKTGKYYCTHELRSKCFCCNGHCGPTNGCNCYSCMELDVKSRKLPKGFLVNRYGFVSRISPETDKFYCGRIYTQRSLGHDGYCGPTNGPNCKACANLDMYALAKYAKLLKK